jgi:hypothetical protein
VCLFRLIEGRVYVPSNTPHKREGVLLWFHAAEITNWVYFSVHASTPIETFGYCLRRVASRRFKIWFWHICKIRFAIAITLDTRKRTWFRHYATSRKVAGSRPDEVDIFSLPNSSSCTMALGWTQALKEMSTSNLPGGKCGRSVGA